MGSDINVIQCQEEKKRRSEMASIFHGHPVFMGVKVKQDKLLYIVCKGNCAPLPSFFLSSARGAGFPVVFCFGTADSVVPETRPVVMVRCS